MASSVVFTLAKIRNGRKTETRSQCGIAPHLEQRLPEMGCTGNSSTIPSLNRSIAEALIDHHRVIEKIRADIPAGELTLQDMESFNDQRRRRHGDRAIKTMWPLQWRAPVCF